MMKLMVVYLCDHQSPSMGRRPAPEKALEAEVSTNAPNGETASEPRAPLTSAQKLAASAATGVEIAPDPFGREAKHFTETHTLHRDVKQLPFSCYVNG